MAGSASNGSSGSALLRDAAGNFAIRGCRQRALRRSYHNVALQHLDHFLPLSPLVSRSTGRRDGRSNDSIYLQLGNYTGQGYIATSASTPGPPADSPGSSPVPVWGNQRSTWVSSHRCQPVRMPQLLGGSTSRHRITGGLGIHISPTFQIAGRTSTTPTSRR